jgi:hypothetical protein
VKEALEQRLVGLLFPLQDFGTLSEYLAQQILTDDLMDSLSPQAREGAVRAVATMMVLAQNYHPNMLVLLIRIGATFDMDNRADYDDWDRFLKILNTVEAHERYFLLDLLCEASAFDGKLSRLKKYHLLEVYQEFTDTYMQRVQQDYAYRCSDTCR